MAQQAALDSAGQAHRSATPPTYVDRIIVHQFDPAQASPGGIDTCIRGITSYHPPGQTIAVVGVDARSTDHPYPGRRIGEWELHNEGERAFWFLPVARLDPADQRRRVPHSARVVGGVARFRNRLPSTAVVQVHRMDTALALRAIVPSPQAYFIHTQESGLVGSTSDSFWRFAGATHSYLERRVISNAVDVVVFNRDYAETVTQWNPRARFLPTWFDPALITSDASSRGENHVIVWVGRLETPKDPVLAIRAFAELAATDAAQPWTLRMLGSGTLEADVASARNALPSSVRSRVHLLGRVAPAQVAAEMAGARVFLMTSHAGYEGYPRVLVESLASGLSAVVTEGSDTGALIQSDRNGYVTSRAASDIARRITQAQALDPRASTGSVRDLDAPHLVAKIFAP